MKKIKSFLVLGAVLASSLTYTTSAKEFTSMTGKVIDVIDGDSLKVVIPNSKKVEYVRLLGVDSQGNDKAFNYMNNELLGRKINLEPDSNYTKPSDRWLYAYVYCDGVLVNEKLVEKGFAVADTNFRSARNFSKLETSQKKAENQGYGIWEQKEEIVSSGTKDSKININTADKYTIKSFLVDVDDKIVDEIIFYRSKYNFNRTEDIKNVSGFTTSLYDKNYKLISAKTNINDAGEKELHSLNVLSYSEIDSIIRYRENNKFKRINELYKSKLISEEKYDKIKFFIEA